jgi:hypothetical protein
VGNLAKIWKKKSCVEQALPSLLFLIGEISPKREIDNSKMM